MRVLWLGLSLAAACQRADEKAAPVAVDFASAQAAYDVTDWAKCAAQFTTVAATAPEPQKRRALYNAANCQALDDKPDRAFAALDGAIAAGLLDARQAKNDRDFVSLHDDPRWQRALDAIAANDAAWRARLKEPVLHDELLALVEEDQRVRKAWIAHREDEAAHQAVMATDRISIAKLHEIVDRVGWPGRSLVGEDGAHSAFLLVQHADQDVELQRRCLALITPLVAIGEVNEVDAAYLYDRVAVAEHRAQRYGTQGDGTDPTLLIEDPANVDARRKAIGLEPLAEYRERLIRMYGPWKPR